MSDSINFKVVVFWIIFVFILFGIALFGYFNKDLIETKKVEPYVPTVNTTIKSCSTALERGKVTYELTLENNTIKTVKIVYNAINGTIDDYAAATSISNAGIQGFNTVLANEYTNFNLTVTYNSANIDAGNLVNVQSFLNELNIMVSNESVWDNYNTLLSNTYGSVACVNK